MIKILFIVLFSLFSKPNNICDLKGRVEIVDFGEDYKVRVVDYNENLRVKFVEAFPNNPGEWQPVEHHPLFKVRFVDRGEDFRIKIVNSFPRCNNK